MQRALNKAGTCSVPDGNRRAEPAGSHPGESIPAGLLHYGGDMRRNSDPRPWARQPPTTRCLLGASNPEPGPRARPVRAERAYIVPIRILRPGDLAVSWTTWLSHSAGPGGNRTYDHHRQHARSPIVEPTHRPITEWANNRLLIGAGLDTVVASRPGPPCRHSHPRAQPGSRLGRGRRPPPHLHRCLPDPRPARRPPRPSHAGSPGVRENLPARRSRASSAGHARVTWSRCPRRRALLRGRLCRPTTRST